MKTENDTQKEIIEKIDQSRESTDDYLVALHRNIKGRVEEIIFRMLAIRGPKGAPESEIMKLISWALEPTYKAIMVQAIVDGKLAANIEEGQDDPSLYLPEWNADRLEKVEAQVADQLEKERKIQQEQIEDLKNLVRSQMAEFRKTLAAATKITRRESVVVAAQRETIIEPKSAPIVSKLPEKPTEKESAVETDILPPLPKLPLKFATRDQARSFAQRCQKQGTKVAYTYADGWWTVDAASS